MLVFPQLIPEIRDTGCRVSRWIPAERFAPYFARPTVLPHITKQDDDDDSRGGSSPEHYDSGVEIGEGVCGWRGCGARFPNVARLSAHVARLHAHAHRDGLFYCSWKDCSRPQRGFNARYKMLVHVRTHTNERPHTCNQCQKSFSRAENLKIHLRSHSGEKPYVCPYEGCGKAYSNSSDRFKHTRTHTVDKPYSCKVPGCNKRYTDPSSLRKHVKTYKHFANEMESTRRTSSDDRLSSDNLSPLRDNIYVQPQSPNRKTYSPTCITSPTLPYSSLIPSDAALGAPLTYVPVMDQLHPYSRPLDMYPIRVPSNEMSYLEYSQMYDHAYRNYYSCSFNYSVLRPDINEKAFTYDEQERFQDITLNNASEAHIPEELPLNLICAKRMDYQPLTELVRQTDLPLDLSTKS
ncbi:zinc finger protein GLIS3-like [Pararge aegeria]|uniref:Jg26793 protein n=2 Tax=Pararge aegeria TaxID=116150 RepID=A0A8S4SG42_9NEOP|nr:zinc finger protein GLIS3-like [Pararge aegeria]CAH2262112.1 jg26793 [Pararge aegeria aegeria]